MNKRIIPALETSDGAGVKIFRSLGHTQEVRLDPFLMLDEFCSENPNDYIGGFPSHPHRGFETFTYMIEGHLKHCLLYTSPSPRDKRQSRMPSSA